MTLSCTASSEKADCQNLPAVDCARRQGIYLAHRSLNLKSYSLHVGFCSEHAMQSGLRIGLQSQNIVH